MMQKEALSDVVDELNWALRHYPPMASYHEGWAILREEDEELWDEIKLKPSERNVEDIRAEAKQIAAMAIRFMMDLT